MTFPSLLLISSAQMKEGLSQALVVHTKLPPYTPLEHPDIIILSPLEGKTLISIDQIHALINRPSFFPTFLSHTRIVVHPAELLSIPAQQALLKTLEEPPEWAQLILVTDKPSVLLPTILSRCVQVLSDSKTDSSEKSVQTPRSYSDCLKLSDTFSGKRDEAKLLLETCVTSPGYSATVKKCALEALKKIGANGNIKLVLDTFFFSVYRDMMTLHSVKP